MIINLKDPRWQFQSQKAWWQAQSRVFKIGLGQLDHVAFGFDIVHRCQYRAANRIKVTSRLPDLSQ